ncbi:MAG: CHAT domain-containing protein [Cyclobacteriaceae bacterium]
MKAFTISLLMLISLCANAQEWADQYQQAVTLYDNFQLREARTAAERALSIFKEENPEPHQNQAAILRQLSLICYEMASDDAAIAYAKEELTVLDAINQNGTRNYAISLSNLALIYSANSQYEESLKLLEEGLRILESDVSEDFEELANMQGNYAVALFNTQQDELAGEYFDKSLSTLQGLEEVGADYLNILYNYGLFKELNGDLKTALEAFDELEEYYSYELPNFEYAGILINSGDILDQQGKYSEAVSKYKIAIDNLEQLSETESTEYTIAQSNLARDYQRLGKFDQAESILSTIVLNRVKKIGNDPEAFSLAAISYAILLNTRGANNDANKYLDQALKCYEDYSLPKNAIYITGLETKSKIALASASVDLALSSINEAVDLAVKIKQDNQLYALESQKSKVLSRLGRYSEAQKSAQNALALSNAQFGADAIQTAFVQSMLAGLETQMGDYKKAENLFRQSLPVFEKVFGTSHPEYATIIGNYSSLLQLSGKYQSAETYLLKAIDAKLQSFGATNLEYLSAFENLGLLYITTARFTEADAVFQTVLSEKQKQLPSSDPSLAFTFANYGLLKKQVADYPLAEEYLRKAVTGYAGSLGKNHISYASSVNNLALLYLKMGNLGVAKPLFIEALNVYEAKLGKVSPDYSTASLNLATLYQMEGDLNQAKVLLEEVRAIDQQLLGEYHPLYAKTLHNLASLYNETEEFDKAKSLYQQSLQITENSLGSNHPSYASTLYNIAVLEQELEEFENAQRDYQTVVQIRSDILGENHPDYAYALYGLAAISQRIGDYETARQHYQTVIEKYLKNIQDYFPALSESEKSAFYGKIRPIFEAFMDFAIDYARAERGTASSSELVLQQAYNLQLATKALLLNATNKVRNRILNSGDNDLIDLFSDWTAQKENLVKLYALSKEELSSANVDLAQLEEKANETEKQLSLKSSSFAQEFDKQLPQWYEVRDALPEGTAAMEIIRIKMNLKNDSILYAALIIDEQNLTAPKLVVVANGDHLESQGFKIYKNSIMYKVADPKSYPAFWEAIDLTISSSINTLYLSADGVYNKVNIATLNDGKKYVVEKYNIRLLSNTRELLDKAVVTNASSTAQVFGYPKYNLQKVSGDAGGVVDQGGMRYSFGENVSELPGTLEELNNIKNILSEKSWTFSTFQEANATESNVKAIDNPKIFHVATHGFFLEDKGIKDEENEGLSSRSMKFNPLMRSGLLFAGAENTIRDEKIPGDDDGILTAYEAMNLNLDDTDLVVLSACETGLGEVKNGEGVYGLQRAFMVAGAQNLIMSLWKVNDETTQLLMSTFYSEWFDGKSRTDAFNAAIQRVKKDFKQPYYWGAFVMLGK